MNTHSHQVLPLTRAEVSSEHTTRTCGHGVADRRRCEASKGSRARASMLLIAPSLMARLNMSPIQGGQPLHGPDGVGIVQVDYQGGDRLTERRAEVPVRAVPARSHVRRNMTQPCRRTAATRVMSGLIGRQLDAIIHLLRRLLLDRKRGGAMRAGVERGIDDVVRVRLQHVRSRDGFCAAACRRWDDWAFVPSTAAARNCPVSSADGSNPASRFSSSAMRASAKL